MDLFLSFKNPILGVIAGAVLTAVLQSSSASVGILQALTSTGAVTYSAAVPIIMGQNIGTTVTALISSAGANKNAKRTAFVHLYFNVIGTILFLCGFYGLNALIGFAFFNETANTFGIAIVHTIFNVVTTAILLPFNRLLEKLAILTVPDSPSDKKQENTLLDERLLTTPSVAVGRAMLTAAIWPRSAAPRSCRPCPPPAPGMTPSRTKSCARRTPLTIMRTCWAPTLSN